MKVLATKPAVVFCPKDGLEYIDKCACYSSYCATMLTKEKNIEVRCLGFAGHMCLRTVSPMGMNRL